MTPVTRLNAESRPATLSQTLSVNGLLVPAEERRFLAFFDRETAVDNVYLHITGDALTGGAAARTVSLRAAPINASTGQIGTNSAVPVASLAWGSGAGSVGDILPMTLQGGTVAASTTLPAGEAPVIPANHVLYIEVGASSEFDTANIHLSYRIRENIR